MPSLNSPPLPPEDDAPLSKLPFAELAPPFWLVVCAVALPDPVADDSNENSSVCDGCCREGVWRAFGFGAPARALGVAVL